MSYEREDYAKLIVSMSTDCLMAKITWETYLKNLNMIVNILNEKESEVKKNERS